MVFEQIEKLKLQYTDKYVVVDGSRPELLRFARMTGRVRTVNMNGRALVEFNANNNIGWYDIDLAYLKLVDAPPAEDVMEKKAAKPADAPKPAAKAAPAKVEKQAPAVGAKKPDVKKPAAAGASVADILAMARGGGEATTPKPAKDVPAAAKPPAAVPKAPPAGGDAKKMSVSDILAAARGGAGPTAPPAAAAAPKPPAPAPPTKATPKSSPAPVDTPKAVEAPPQATSRAAQGGLPTATAEVVDWCRKRDSA